MTPSEKSLSQILQIEGNQEHYFIPKYQRPYKWGRENWNALLRDIDEDQDHFMGSIICVARRPDSYVPGEEIFFELIDGQQRLTTLSLLLCAIYRKLGNLRPSAEDGESAHNDFVLLRHGIAKKLIKEKPLAHLSPNEIERPVERSNKIASFTRLTPSSQNDNLTDYTYVLHECGLLKKRVCPAYWGNRRIAQCFLYFEQHIPTDIVGLTSLVEKINNLRFIHISVPSHSDAYRLFETLNNRGEPLSALDIIKNGLLAKIDQQKKDTIEDAFEKWKEMTDCLTEDENIQERYLRHFYHAFKNQPSVGIDGYPRATRSSIIRIYEALAKKDPSFILKALVYGALLYQQLVSPNSAYIARKSRRSIFVELSRVGAVPAHQVLLYLLSVEERGFVESEHTVDEIAEFLVRYFVRRNITDQPATNRLDSIFIDLIETCERLLGRGGKISSSFVRVHLTGNKIDKPADDIAFRKRLEDNLWNYNSGMARYVLCRLDESFSTREYAPNLWQRDERNLLLWTVEHVLPQTENLRSEWIEMIADGDKARARDIQEEWVDCLGNLTLSAYNSKLSDKPFPDKQISNEVTVAGDALYTGYQNGLALNNLPFKVLNSAGNFKEVSLASSRVWTAKEIEARNQAIVERLLKLFRL